MNYGPVVSCTCKRQKHYTQLAQYRLLVALVTNGKKLVILELYDHFTMERAAVEQ